MREKRYINRYYRYSCYDPQYIYRESTINFIRDCLYKIFVLGIPYTISFSEKTASGTNLILDRSDRKRTSNGYRNHDFKTRRRTWMMFAKILAWYEQVYDSLLPLAYSRSSKEQVLRLATISSYDCTRVTTSQVDICRSAFTQIPH